MQPKPQEQVPVPGPDVTALGDGHDRELLAGPIEKLVSFYGLGARVVSALEALGCKVGKDVLYLKPNQQYSVCSGSTAQRIMLLREHLQLKQKIKDGGAAGPSQEAEKIAVGDAGGRENFV